MSDPSFNKRGKRSKLFLLLLLLTFLTVLFQWWVYFRHAQGGIGFLVDLFIQGSIQVPRFVWAELGYFVLAQLIVYGGYTLLIWAVARLVAYQLKLSWKATCWFAMALWFLASLGLLLANQLFAPNSLYAHFLRTLLPAVFIKGLGVLVGTFLLSCCGLALWTCFKWGRKKLAKKPFYWVLVAAGFGGGFTLMQPIYGHSQLKTVEAQKPNVIIIGIDALRPDYVVPWLMPHLTQFLNHSVYFTQSYTPLARTFPSYAALLTGTYPEKNGVQFNLSQLNPGMIHNLLSVQLQKQGYTTFYSTDDTQYTALTKKLGFDYTPQPPDNVLNYILSRFDDFPLLNLLADTWLGKWLFPYTYNNRSASVMYHPANYQKSVLAKLSTIKSRPLFMIVHFCLPHYPFTWADQSFSSDALPDHLYSRAVQRVDEQFYQFVKGLRHQGLLQNAIVVVWSDHGNALFKAHGRLVDKQHYVKGQHSTTHIFKKLLALREGSSTQYFDRSFTHGTDVLSLVQFHHVLAFRSFGSQIFVPHRTSHQVSVLDIKPTLLQLLHEKVPDNVRGYSLLPALENKPLSFNHQILYFSTGYNPFAVYHLKFSGKAFLKEVSSYLKVDSHNGELKIKPSKRADVLKSRQLAAWYRHWYLAIYPKQNAPDIKVLVNLKTGRWTDDLRSDFARRAPVSLMLAKLQHHFKLLK